MARVQRPQRARRDETPTPAQTRARRERATRVPVVLPDEPRAAAWLRNFRLSGFALSILLLIVAALVVLAPNLKTFIEQRQQIAALQQSVIDAQADVDVLNAEIDRWSDPAYIEAQARDRLYYVYPGDITFLVIGDENLGLDEGGLPISDEIQTTRVDWVRALLSTVYEAGLTDASPSELDGKQLESPQQGG